MRYFYLIYAIIALTVVAIFGIPGQIYTSLGLDSQIQTRPPIRLFGDMDEQDKTKAQSRDLFFADNHGSRLPAAGSQPRGFNPEGLTSKGGVREPEFGGQVDAYHTGKTNDGQYAQGFPAELELKSESDVVQLIKRGREVYSVNCTPCHGTSGNGKGMTLNFGVPAIRNLHEAIISEAQYPNGRLFETITQGKGNMSGYGYNISVRDRWAVVAYVRTLQAAKSVSK